MALTTSLSPAIDVKEIDLTGVAPNVETSLTGMVGNFKWGPVDEPTRIQNENQLVEVFGSPTDNSVDFYSAAQYLRYSSNLILNRATKQPSSNDVDSAFNSSFSGNAALVVNNDAQYEGMSRPNETFLAKYPSALGNSISISLFALEGGDSPGTTQSITNFDQWAYKDRVDGIPGTSVWAAQQGIDVKHDEVHVVVVDSDGLISGVSGSVLEVFPFVSVALGAKTVDNGNNYIEDVINNGSKYIRFGKFEDSPGAAMIPQGTNWGKYPSAVADGTGLADYNAGTKALTFDRGVTDGNTSGKARVYRGMTGGADCSQLSASDYAFGFDNFEDPETVDVQILVAPAMDETEAQKTVVADLVGIAAATRKDCVVVTSPNRAAVVGNATPVTSTLATTNGFPASNYLFVDNNWLRVRDNYNDRYIYVPAASSTAGLFAATDASYGPWYSPAGEKRGQYFGATSLAYSPNKSDRDTLYKAGVNSIVEFSGRGILLFGDKTKQSRPSAFDRINVRRLFLAIEKTISIAARNFMFEFNDEFTRSEFVAIVEPVLREIQARRGISDFFVQCDERNNTSEVVSRNELVASMFVKPAFSINFITLNFVATRDGAAFEEVVGTLS